MGDSQVEVDVDLDRGWVQDTAHNYLEVAVGGHGLKVEDLDVSWGESSWGWAQSAAEAHCGERLHISCIIIEPAGNGCTHSTGIA